MTFHHQCTRCILDDTIPGVTFDEQGVCNYCHQHNEFNTLYPMSYKRLYDICEKMKKDGKGKEFDAVAGVSGGCDSSYMIIRLKQMGVRILGIHADNGWNTRTSDDNLNIVIEKIGIPVIRKKIDYDTFNTLCRGFLFASTPDADIVNDLMLLEVIQQGAYDRDIEYVLNGHSFRTEGMAPLGWTYMDGGYVEDINKKFCRELDITNFPHLSWDNQMSFFERGLKNIRPLYWMDYNKEDIKVHLSEQYGWVWYSGLHAENIYTKFVGRYLWMKKFKIDYRKIEFSALIRAGLLSKDEAKNRLLEPLDFEPEYFSLIKRKLYLDQDDFSTIMNLPLKSYRDYNTYLPRFRDPKNRPLFDKLMDEQKISRTFYNKYILGV